jgi:16S rRNA (adenine1518-N6/adenine1519-N6)-dimethyltransferase
LKVSAKKHLGQHFLKEPSICQKIVEALNPENNYKTIIEVGPGMGALTQFLLQSEQFTTFVSEIDTESVAYLKKNYPSLSNRIFEEDFLKMDLSKIDAESIAVVGNFPYNISTQILLKVVDNKNLVPEMVGMFQKEVAERVACPEGSKTYGITSVLTQLWYNVSYLFTVKEGSFIPPPKVKSGVIKLSRNQRVSLPVEEKFLYQIIKQSFNQRRKTLRNSLKSFLTNPELAQQEVFNLRPEQVSPEGFINLAVLIKQYA